VEGADSFPVLAPSLLVLAELHTTSITKCSFLLHGLAPLPHTAFLRYPAPIGSLCWSPLACRFLVKDAPAEGNTTSLLGGLTPAPAE